MRRTALGCAVIVLATLLPSIQAQRPKALLLFGGEGHKTFLGCVNCSEISTSSVCNNIGKYGSTIARDSIWNSIGQFGSTIGRYSPWNSIASEAPIIVDEDGNSYGYFSVNAIHRDRTRLSWLVSILDYYDKLDDLDSLEKTRTKMCGE